MTLVLAVSHDEYKNMNQDLLYDALESNGFIYDLKNTLASRASETLKKL